MTLQYLVDKSAFARMYVPTVSAALEPLISGGEVGCCGIIALEVLFSARGPVDLELTRRELVQALTTVPTHQVDFDRAIDVMQALSHRGLHRSVSIPDLLVAAVAERAGLCVLHYDQDFDRIAEITAQPVRWVAPRGSL